jgi:beta-phosphoglucomutase
MNLDFKPAVIFDIDGTLIDSYWAHFESWRGFGLAKGRDMTEEEFLETFGRVTPEIVAMFWGEGTISPETIREWEEAKEAKYRSRVRENFPGMAGAVELIDALVTAGFAIAAGSSGPPDNVFMVLDKLERRHVFDAVVTGHDVSRGKPDPEVFLTAARKLGLPPDQCAVIEDAPMGIEAANAAGMASIALVSTGHTFESLAAAQLSVATLSELTPETIGRVIQKNRCPNNYDTSSE